MADKRVIEQTASTELYNDDWFLKDSVVEGTTKISAAKLKELLGADGTLALEEIANSIAEEYDSTHTYAYNSWVFHEGTLYRCIGNNVTGTWNATKWQAKTIKQFIADSENLITGRLLQMLGEYLPISTLDPPSIEAISKGDIFIYQRTNRYKFYRAKADHPQGVTEFDIDDWDEFDTVADLIEDVTEKIDEIEIPVKDVQVKTDSTYDSVVDASGNARIDLSSVTAYGEVPNLPQAIATFKDGADAPMPSLKVGIEPQQDLHGYDAPWAGGAGKNKLPYFTAEEKNGIRLAYDNGVVVLDGTASANAFFSLSNLNLTSNNYVFSANNDTVNNDVHISLRKVGASSDFADLPMNDIDKYNIYQNVSIGQVTLYVLSGTRLTNFRLPLQIEVGDSKTDFSPYSNICPISGYTEVDVTVADDVENPTVSNVYTIDLDGTRYGGEVDVVNGIVTPAPYYASYNGETLTGEWISDRDKYEVGATPTIGAQVVNIGASGTPVSILPTAIKSLRGVNNVYANTGDINDCVYRRDMTSTIDDIIARLEALEG